jgi:stage II sporulation protein D
VRATPTASVIELLQNGEVLTVSRGRSLELTTSESAWQLGANRYAGDLRLLRTPAGGLTLVNVVDLEVYLRGVVPWEIGRPQSDALAAVEAQAIAARTYAYEHLGRWEDLGFDVFDSVADQVYRGLTGTHPLTDRAVAETRGKVLVYRGHLVRAYYCSTCGGHTSTIEDVWPRDPADYLVGRRDADHGRSWCRESPHFRWTEAWTAKELGDQIRQHLAAELDTTLTPQQIGKLTGLQIVRRDASGRVQRLRIVTDRARFEVWGDRIRWVLRPVRGRFGILRSTLFDLEEIRREGRLGAVVVRGGGFGHGVGMCQTGALAMARHGRSAAEILRHYYRGAEIVEIGSLRALP